MRYMLDRSVAKSSKLCMKNTSQFPQPLSFQVTTELKRQTSLVT